MIKNFIKIACRSLWRNKGFSAINIAGLAIGIATCLIILLFVQNELSFDRYNEKADRMVRVVLRGYFNGEKLKEANVMPPVAQTLKKDYPEVLEATRLRNYGLPRISYGTQTFREFGLAFVDSNFFQVFTLPFVKGDPATALSQPNAVVISEPMAKKYFGSEDPIGKIITFKDQNTTARVTGVIREMPSNSHFHFDLFASMSGLAEARSTSWMTSEYFTYLVLPEGYNYKKLQAKMPQVIEKYLGGADFQKALGMSLAEFRKKGNDLGLFLQPLTDIHLHSDLTNDLAPAGDIRYVYILSAVALFMLLIACINFMNLSTASASKRAKEVGIRKVMGSVKGQLVGQFLLESLMLTAIALLLAVGIVYLVLPAFNALSGKNLSLQIGDSPWLFPGLLLLGLVTGILAGSYPAFFLSSFNPVTVLKGRFTSGKGSISLRSGLVVFQFFISITLMVGTAVVYKQLSYMQHKKLGYDKDQVLIIHEPFWLGNKEDAFRQQLLTDPRVLQVSTSGFLPAGPSDNNNFFVFPDDKSTRIVKTLRYDVDYNYITAMGMQMESGRNFSREFGTDSAGAILNEAAAIAMGWGNRAIGHTISKRENDGKMQQFRIVGVVKDFHFRSLHERISPLVMTLGKNSDAMIVRTKTKDIGGLLGSMKKQWSGYTNEAPFAYSFLDERFRQTFQAEQTIGTILAIFAGLTIFVACLGLFGLATFTAVQRTKEIGIRKVIGASVTGIVTLLSKDFLKLVGIAFLVAAPISWFFMNKWIQDFAYRTEISWWIFGLAAMATLSITLITVSFQAVKAAVSNPVDALRSE